MEYIYTESIPDNLNMYIDEFHTSMKAEFEKSISKIYSNEISVYKDVVETIVKLPFIQKIINENKVLKAKIVDLENMNNGVKLEITDKPISKNILDIEKIPFYKDSEEEDEENENEEEDEENEEEDEEDEEKEEKEDEEVTDTESKMYFDTKMESKKDLLYNEKYKHVYGDDGETVWSVERNQYGVNNDNQDSSSPLLAYKEAYVVTRQENVAETKEEEEDEEEECEDEECEDEEDENEEETLNNMPTFPSKVSNKLEKEPSADEEQPSADEEQPSADEEETSEVFEIEIDDVTYYCDDEENGNIYEDKNGEVGDIVGKIKDGEASFFE
jgi:hypothetical protein